MPPRLVRAAKALALELCVAAEVTRLQSSQRPGSSTIVSHVTSAATEEVHAVADYFALLSQPRRPWLDPEQLKNRFIELSGQLHPDRVHASSSEEKRLAQQNYTEINAAYQCLLHPRDRLAHLLELEGGKKP